MCNNTFCGPTGRAPTSIPPPGNPFYPLANPKGTDLKCEVCSKPAYLQCSLCHVTYYCGLDHQKIDWISIHERICSTLANLRKPISFIASEDERRKKKEETLQLQIQMVELTQMIGQKLLFEGKPEEAVPAALQCLKFTVDAYGLASVELVTPYLILAESSIGLNRLDQAEAYLAQAQWTMLKTQHQCSNAIRSQLQRKLALLFAAKGDYQAALESLAQDIYYSSCDFGPNHIRTSGGYFQMAEVFYLIYLKEKGLAKEVEEEDRKNPLRVEGMICPSSAPQIPTSEPRRPPPPALVIKDRIPPEEPVVTNSPLYMSRIYKNTSVLPKPVEKDRVADDLFARVVDIWATYLATIVQSIIKKPTIPEGCGSVVAEITMNEKMTLGEAEAAECLKMLHAINNYRTTRAVKDGIEFIALAAGRPDPRARLHLALAMVYFILEEKAKAHQYLEDAEISVKAAEENKILTEELELIKSALS
ncbi:Zinc finger MYND domain-containing protein 12 [Sparganum proliferum]